MENFQFQNPTKIIFGADTIGELKNLLPKKRILILYGEGSIRANGVYDQVMEAIKGFEIVEFGGVPSNPTYEKATAALEVIHQKKIQFILAVGGGSVIDLAKFISLASVYQGNPWDIMEQQGLQLNDALPLGTVLTMPASGSEMNCHFVLSNEDRKLSQSHPLAFPQFSILDPKVTMSLTAKQTGNGVVDAFVHTMEQYLTSGESSPLQDRMAESILLTLIEEGTKILSDPNNYNTRANLMWCSTLALNGLVGSGVPQDWSTHALGHELTALYGLDHARTLAVILPAVMWTMRKEKHLKIKQYSQRVWNLKGDDEELVQGGIQKTIAFFESLGLPTKLSAYQIGPEVIPQITSRLILNGQLPLGETGQVTKGKVKEILETAL